MQLFVVLGLVSLDPTVIALIGTLMGGVGLKIAEHWLGKKQVKVNDAAVIRTELRTDLAALRKENGELEDDRDLWREKYYQTFEKLAYLRVWVKGKGLEPPE